MKEEAIKPYYISLGAGTHQVPLIEAAIKAGYRVIGVDRNLNAPGMALCDVRLEESILNFNRIAMKLDMAMLDAEIEGGYSASFGEALISWASLAERYHLCAPPRTLLERLLDKYTVRETLAPLEGELEGFFQPAYELIPAKVAKSSINRVGFPLIIKTRSGHGKKHVYEFKIYEELKPFLSRKNFKELGIKPGELIMEEKVGGSEITVVGLVQNFDFTLVAITDKKCSSASPFIELEHTFPSEHAHLKPAIIEIHDKIVKTLQLTDTPLVSEWKVKNGNLYLVELSLQIPGEYLGSFLIPEATGYDFFGNLIALTAGRRIDPTPGEKQARRGYVRFLPRPIPEGDWIDLSKEHTRLCKILNKSPKLPPESNHDRYAVVGRAY